MNAFKRLYRLRLQAAQKPFLARGATVVRCSQCHLAEKYCICNYMRALPLAPDFDVVLLMHRDEILKPTNTGRLLADAFPDHCFVFEWSRLEPNGELIKILEDVSRQCAVIYPAKQLRSTLGVSDFDMFSCTIDRAAVARRPTFVLLDGTWRQAARMFNHSEWLKNIPTLTLPEPAAGGYSVRKSCDSSRLSTAEAAVLLLQHCGQGVAGEHLAHMFSVFNRHCSATRNCTDVEVTPSHQYLLQLPQRKV